MTAREEAQLEKLLKKKEEEEAATKAFFTQVKRRRKEAVHALGLEEAVAVHEAMKKKAEQAGVTVEEFLSVVQGLPNDWVNRKVHTG